MGWGCGQGPANACGCLSLCSVGCWLKLWGLDLDSLHTYFSPAAWLCASRRVFTPPLGVGLLIRKVDMRVLSGQGFHSCARLEQVLACKWMLNKAWLSFSLSLKTDLSPVLLDEAFCFPYLLSCHSTCLQS